MMAELQQLKSRIASIDKEYWAYWQVAVGIALGVYSNKVEMSEILKISPEKVEGK